MTRLHQKLDAGDLGDSWPFDDLDDGDGPMMCPETGVPCDDQGDPSCRIFGCHRAHPLIGPGDVPVIEIHTEDHNAFERAVAADRLAQREAQQAGGRIDG